MVLLISIGKPTFAKKSFLKEAALEFVRLHFKDQSQYMVGENNGVNYHIKDMAEWVILKAQQEYNIPVEINDNPYRDFYCKIYFLESSDLFL